MDNKYKEQVKILKALSDETRIQIVETLLNGEFCACKILENFNITQPTLSYHMKILTECGLISARREGAWMKYSLNKQNLEAVKNVFNSLNTIIKQDDEGNSLSC